MTQPTPFDVLWEEMLAREPREILLFAMDHLLGYQYAETDKPSTSNFVYDAADQGAISILATIRDAFPCHCDQGEHEADWKKHRKPCPLHQAGILAAIVATEEVKQ